MWRNISGSSVFVGDSIAMGFADKILPLKCQSCNTVVRHDDLKLIKFRKDMEALRKWDYPMPGTILSLDGTRQASASTGRHLPCFPNRLLKTNGSLHTNLLYRTAPGKTSNSVDGIWTEFELALKDRKLIKTANGTFSATLQKEERIAIRRMMSRYWENSLPFALDLIGAVVRQGSFIEKMHATD